MFASMLFDPDYQMVAQETSSSMRGFYLGVLLAIMPLCQFFSAPIWGAASDHKGRKKPLLHSLSLGVLGYFTAFCSTYFYSLSLLFISRALIGLASGNVAIIQASLADISDENSKLKNYGLYSMALGTGFALGPFIGGILSKYSYSLPFLTAIAILVINLFLSTLFLKDTLFKKSKEPFKIRFDLLVLKTSLTNKALRGTFFASFLHNFGWCYFFEFIPVFLFQILHFSRGQLGGFYGTAGIFYAFSGGVLIRPIVDRFKPLTIFQSGLLLTSLVVISMSFVTQAYQLWPFLFLLCFFAALVTPSATAYISAKTSSENQGKVLGSLSAMNSIALILSPLASGAFVGRFPKMSMYLGGAVIMIAAFVSFIFQKKEGDTT